MSNIRTIVTQFVEKKAMIDSLNKELDALKAEIIKFNAGRDEVTENGVQTKIITGTRSTVQIGLVEKLLGHEIPSDCYKYTNYQQVRAKILAA